MIDYALLHQEAARHPYPLLFATISGAHLYGFPSCDSDYDLRVASTCSLPDRLSVSCPGGRRLNAPAFVRASRWTSSPTMS
jgi:hypothetical protein